MDVALLRVSSTGAFSGLGSNFHQMVSIPGGPRAVSPHRKESAIWLQAKPMKTLSAFRRSAEQ